MAITILVSALDLVNLSDLDIILTRDSHVFEARGCSCLFVNHGDAWLFEYWNNTRSWLGHFRSTSLACDSTIFCRLQIRISYIGINEDGRFLHHGSTCVLFSSIQNHYYYYYYFVSFDLSIRSSYVSIYLNFFIYTLRPWIKNLKHVLE